jgi:hypothetical protein
MMANIVSLLPGTRSDKEIDCSENNYGSSRGKRFRRVAAGRETVETFEGVSKNSRNRLRRHELSAKYR